LVVAFAAPEPDREPEFDRAPELDRARERPPRLLLRVAMKYLPKLLVELSLVPP
jgi:hypothetical protein